MTADQYLHGILLREAVDAGPNSPLLGVQTTLMPTLRQWAGDNLLGVYPSGSFMKGTAVLSGTDIDLFISLSEHTSETLKDVYNKLFDCLTSAGYSPRRQNVSLNVTVSKYSVDLVPGKRQNALSDDHSLYRRKADTWTKTNVFTHARTVIGAARANEIRRVPHTFAVFECVGGQSVDPATAFFSKSQALSLISKTRNDWGTRSSTLPACSGWRRGGTVCATPVDSR